jgi:hypothetical protein
MTGAEHAHLRPVRSGDFATAELSWHDIETRQYGDTVVTVATQTQQADYKGTPSDGDFRITHVFVRHNDAWIIANIQLSLTTPPTTP